VAVLDKEARRVIMCTIWMPSTAATTMKMTLPPPQQQQQQQKLVSLLS